MKDLLKYSIWAGLYAVLAIPFIVSGGLFFPYITGKAFAFRIIVEIILGLWLILIIKDGEYRPKRSWVSWAVIALTAILFAADLHAVAPVKAFWSNYERMEGWVTFIHLLAYFFVLGSMFNKEKLWLWFLRTNLFVGTALAVFSIDKATDVRFSGPLGNPIYIAVYFLFIFFFTAIVFYKDIFTKKVENNCAYNYFYNGLLYLMSLATFYYIIIEIKLVGRILMHSEEMEVILHLGEFLLLFILAVVIGLSLLNTFLKEKIFNGKFSENILLNYKLYSYLAISVISIFVVYRTSRGALLGALGGIFIAAILVAIFEREKKVLRRIALGGVFAVIILVAGFLSIRNTDFVKNNPTLSRLAEISWSNINGQARQLVWPMALEGFKEKPILGWGQDGFNYVFNKYYDPRMYGQEAWFDRAHNAPLDFLVAAGLLGLLSYLALFISAIYLLWFKKSQGIRAGDLSIVERSLLTGLFAGYLFQAIFVFDNLVSYILFFTTLAYVHARTLDQAVPAKEKKKDGAMAAFFANEEYQDYIFIPVIVILMIISLYFVNYPALKANQTLIQALNLTQSGQIERGLSAFRQALSYNSLGTSEIREQLVSYAPSVVRAGGLSDSAKQAFLDLTGEELNKQIASVPNDARYYYLYGSLLNAVGNPSQALPYLQKAVDLSPGKQAMRFAFIESLYSTGRFAEAVEQARYAYELDKSYDQAKKYYQAAVDGEMRAVSSFRDEGQKILDNLASSSQI